MAQLLELEELPIRVNARGEWLHGDEPLHPRVADLFARNVAYEEGSYYVRVQFRRAPLGVDDTAYFVRRSDITLDAAGDIAAVQLGISDGQREWLDPSTLMQSADNVLYCRIRRGDYVLPCRFNQQQYHELALHADLDSEGAVLTIAGKPWRFGAYSPDPMRAAKT